MKQNRIYIIDDHVLIREGLKSFLEEIDEYVITGSSGDLKTAKREIERQNPDVIILDLSLDNLDTIHFIDILKKEFAPVKVLINTMHDDVSYVERAFRNGADGYVVKSEPIENINLAISYALEGKRYIREELSEKLITRLLRNDSNERDPRKLLSNREIEIFILIGQGFSMGEIAQMLEISVKTANNHRENIKEKLKITNSRELIQVAISWYVENKD